MDKKVVLVTGSSIGLGRAIIEKFASNNYNVIINYNNSKQEAEKLKSYIENTYHTKAITIKCDITKESEIEDSYNSGLSEGKTLGLLEGKSLGKQENSIEIAKKLLAKGTSVSEVSEITGLSKEKIENL